MVVEEFDQLVEKKAPPHLKGSPYLKAVIHDVLTERLRNRQAPSENDVREIIQRADRLYAEWLPPSTESKDTELLFAPSGGDLITSDILLKNLLPWVEDLRREGFGGRQPPFGSIGEAADWIERTSTSDRESRRVVEGQDKIREELDALAGKYAEVSGIRLTLRYSRPILKYQKPGNEHVQNVYVAPGTFLDKLARETKDVAGRTGFTEDTLVVHILTGLKPVLPRIWLSQPGGPHLSRRYATVRFNAADLGFEELRALYNELREYLGGKGKEGLSLEDWEFWRLIEDMGGPPTKWGTKTQFWKEAQQRWNREHKNDGYTTYGTWEGVRNRYVNLGKRVKATWPQD
jgi:hypothetical protein